MRRRPKGEEKEECKKQEKNWEKWKKAKKKREGKGEQDRKFWEGEEDLRFEKKQGEDEEERRGQFINKN
ncbi:hypothetical protein AXF42_Ash018419 [Apostasia shenzhenica]|uniref:Uncharacterized protein n=1 Tax=Apostasia shenzhenica TaxID=1088818 RepID=A0A2I0BEB2_9ASPA|nr:hypothetical protein AXF42_Ash018419 [Apostasia shenzhenica]